MKNFVHHLRRMLHLDEARCPACNEGFTPAGQDQYLCEDCLQKLPIRSSGFCPQCGVPYALSSMPVAPCSACLTTPPVWSSLRFYGVYEDLLRELIIRYKHAPDITLSGVTGHLLQKAVQNRPFDEDCCPEVIVPVPLHPQRLHMRGFNQSQLPARLLASSMGIPLCLDALHRTRNTTAQTGLPRNERRRNLQDAFKATYKVEGKKVLLIDDVMTSGTTVEQCSLALLAAGASQVHVLVAARTPAHSD
ncbi:ComF family protein [Oleidesulfovibrio sp.]|uniref:ComF family protein n=1 Tax=Oleidesulfovibrio sp. TaxID=2909707 RepID=UPI003A8AC7E2